MACLTAVALAVAPAQAVAGPIILGGDDLTSHGNNSGGTNNQGWLYMEKALGNISSQVTRANDNSIAALGSSSGGGGAGNAIASAAGPNGLTVTYYEGAAAINSFFSQLNSGAVNPKIIWISGDDASNDLSDPDPCTDSDPNTTTEGEALANNAQSMENFVSAGGGLMSHGTCYPWLQTLLPGLTTNTSSTGGGSDLYLTPDGQSAFPGVSNSDVGAGPWHNFFEGNFGGLQVLVRSNSVDDGSGNDAVVFLGGAAVTFTAADVSIAKAAPTTSRVNEDLTYTITARNAGPASAQNVTVSDTLPSGLSARSATASQGSCSGTTTVTCSLGTLANGASATVTIVVRPTSAGSITNVARVSANNDNTAGNNEARATTDVQAAPPPPPTVDRTRPTVEVAGVLGLAVRPARCTSRDFRATFRIRDASALRRVDVLLDGRRIRRTSKGTFSVFIDASALRTGVHTLRVIATDRAGNRRVVNRVFRRCARPARRVVPRFTG